MLALFKQRIIVRRKIVLSNLFSRGSKSVLGLDIGSRTVRVLELKDNDGHYRVEAYGQAALAEGAIVDQTINDPSLVARAIESAVEKSGTKAKNVAVALPGSLVISKTVYMPEGLSDEDMDFQVRAEADQHIPYPLDDVALDWEIQNSTPNAGGKIEVLLSACRQENITNLQQAVEQANLNLVVVDIEPFCLEHAFELIHTQIESSQRDVVAVFDIGMSALSLCVLDKGKQVYSREQTVGINMMLEDMELHYAIEDKAEALSMIKKDTLPEGFEEKVLKGFQEAMGEHMNRALQFFYSSTSFDKVTHVVLGGHLIEFTKLAHYAESVLGIPVTRANPFLNMTLSNNVNVELINSESSVLLIATGLALRSKD